MGSLEHYLDKYHGFIYFVCLSLLFLVVCYPLALFAFCCFFFSFSKGMTNCESNENEEKWSRIAKLLGAQTER